MACSHALVTYVVLSATLVAAVTLKERRTASAVAALPQRMTVPVFSNYPQQYALWSQHGNICGKGLCCNNFIHSLLFHHLFLLLHLLSIVRHVSLIRWDSTIQHKAIHIFPYLYLSVFLSCRSYESDHVSI